MTVERFGDYSFDPAGLPRCKYIVWGSGEFPPACSCGWELAPGGDPNRRAVEDEWADHVLAVVRASEGWPK